ncbi:hypothetical protein CS8_024200 [Cupriavidus sp. 8B]
MLQDTDLLQHDVQLLTELYTDLDERQVVVRADALGLGQFVPDFNTR